jgi:predicted PurR-regulated permease PerM
LERWDIRGVTSPAQDRRNPEVVEIDARELTGLFAAPTWLRDLGVMAWLLVGVTALTVAAVWLLSLTQVIVTPVVTAAILAAVLSPLVKLLERRRVPRAVGSALALLLMVALGGLVLVVVLSGIGDQTGALTTQLQHGADKLQHTLTDLGVNTDTAQQANDDASGSISSAFQFLLSGLGEGIKSLASLAVFMSFAALSLFLLLKDGPAIRAWAEGHMALPPALARTVTERMLASLRGYFGGVTAVAVFNAIVVGLGALVLGVPQAGSIAIVNFVGAYVPYIGAWTAGAFTVLIALGAEGPEVALAMAVIVLLANGLLQQLIQPILFGAALGLHPLAVLIVTIAGGALFGTVGLVLAGPVTSAVVKISGDIAQARAAAGIDPPTEPGIAV